MSIESPPGDPPQADPFVAYYARQSATPETRARFERLYDLVLRVRAGTGGGVRSLAMLDIGCNTGEQTLLWAERGHRGFGLEINRDLLAIAEQRRRARGLAAEFREGSATRLPYPDGSMDACLMPELLEHIADWRSCLAEAARVLRAGGVLYLSTTNRLCPRQMEFALPLYGWYPAVLKRRYERLAVTTRPEIVNHAKYPAVNWFTPYELRRHLEGLGIRAWDHFDWIDAAAKPQPARLALAAIRSVPALRWAAHVATPYSMILGVRR